VAPSRRYSDDDDDYGDPGPRRRDDDDYDDDRPSRRRGDVDFRLSRYREDEDDYDDRPSRGGYRCPYCRSDEPPEYRSEISPAGWVVFVLMIAFCLPLCFIGLLMTEQYRVCSDCGRRMS
jgi:hypothetical protein